ncbi:hypothetical protein J2Y41_002159 [Arthrobacter sp. 1088]|nr:hypothetical protein [Arthrobacter sp. 1088]
MVGADAARFHLTQTSKTQLRHEATRAQPIHEHPVTFCLRANHGVLVSQSVIYITFLHVIFAFRMMEPFTWQ